MNDIVDLAKRDLQAVRVSHVADEIAHARVVELMLHFVLLEFIAAENNQLLWLKFLQHNLGKSSSEGTSPSCHQHNLFTPIHFHFCSLPRGSNQPTMAACQLRPDWPCFRGQLRPNVGHCPRSCRLCRRNGMLSRCRRHLAACRNNTPSPLFERERQLQARNPERHSSRPRPPQQRYAVQSFYRRQWWNSPPN